VNDPIVVVVGREHSWSTRNEITLSELKEQPLILSFKSTITRQVIEKQFRKFDMPLKPAFEIGSTEVIKRMVELNLGISILSFSSVKKEVAAGWLKSLVISDLDLFRRINIIYHKEELFSSASIRQFNYKLGIEILIEQGLQFFAGFGEITLIEEGYVFSRTLYPSGSNRFQANL